jgi:formate dehydrogenase assembly factor FdhD
MCCSATRRAERVAEAVGLTLIGRLRNQRSGVYAQPERSYS